MGLALTGLMIDSHFRRFLWGIYYIGPYYHEANLNAFYSGVEKSIIATAYIPIYTVVLSPLIMY